MLTKIQTNKERKKGNIKKTLGIIGAIGAATLFIESSLHVTASRKELIGKPLISKRVEQPVKSNTKKLAIHTPKSYQKKEKTSEDSKSIYRFIDKLMKEGNVEDIRDFILSLQDKSLINYAFQILAQEERWDTMVNVVLKARGMPNIYLPAIQTLSYYDKWTSINDIFSSLSNYSVYHKELELTEDDYKNIINYAVNSGMWEDFLTHCDSMSYLGLNLIEDIDDALDQNDEYMNIYDMIDDYMNKKDWKILSALHNLLFYTVVHSYKEQEDPTFRELEDLSDYFAAQMNGLYERLLDDFPTYIEEHFTADDISKLKSLAIMTFISERGSEEAKEWEKEIDEKIGEGVEKAFEKALKEKDYKLITDDLNPYVMIDFLGIEKASSQCLKFGRQLLADPDVNWEDVIKGRISIGIIGESAKRKGKKDIASQCKQIEKALKEKSRHLTP